MSLKYFRDVHEFVAGKDKFNYTPFYKKFPILNEEITEPGTFGFSYLNYILAPPSATGWI